MSVCLPAFRDLAAQLSNTHCDSHHPFVTVTSPASLQNWTMPVMEVMTLVATALVLVHAVRRFRHQGDASNLVVWLSGLITPLLVETVTYFPQWFGVYHTVGLTFVHNQFSVQLLYDRLPLYIMATYCFWIYIGYAVVQRAGIFRRYPAVVGAACAAFVTNAIYAPFDQVAPQLLWWVWNNDVPTGVPTLGVVPVISTQVFNIAMPFASALLARLLCRNREAHVRTVVRGVAIISVLTWPMIFLVTAPAKLLSALGIATNTARSITLWIELAVLCVVAVVAFTGAWRARRSGDDILDPGTDQERIPMWCAIGALALAAVFWASALPDYLSAHHGRTPSGAPISSLPFGVAAYLAGIVVIAIIYGRLASRERPESTTASLATVRRSRSQENIDAV